MMITKDRAPVQLAFNNSILTISDSALQMELCVSEMSFHGVTGREK